MFEKMTFENIMADMLGLVSEDMDKRQGSIIYDALAPVAAELAKVYVDLDMVINNCFANTAVRQYLVMRASERGILPYQATKGVFKGEFNIDVEIGTRFRLDSYNYRVIEKISEGVFKLQCETEGSAANGVLGAMIPVEYIEGLTVCRLTQMLIPGEDEEDTEHFRKRYFSLLNRSAFGGNIQDYKERVKAIEGVGQVRVYRSEQWQGAGTVGIRITDSNNSLPSTSLTEKVQNEIDPNDGSGEGIAPIGHIVAVESAQVMAVDVAVSVLLAQGISQSLVKAKIDTVVREYFADKNSVWEEEDIYLYASQLNALLLKIEGIVSINSLTLNDNSSYIYLQDKICELSLLEVDVQYAE